MNHLEEGFINPQDEFTPIPFWFWNDNLTEPEIKRQIQDFNDKGVKGFVIHPRIGIPKEIEYLSERFMELVSCAVIKAHKLGMKVVLYDEAMYPSGSAHGMVVKKKPEYASKGLKMTEYRCIGQLKITLTEEEAERLISVQAVKKVSENEFVPESLTKIQVMNSEIIFRPAEEGDWYLLLFSEVFTGGHIRGIHFGEDDGEKETPSSADLLNPEAVKEFINLTHERYFEVLQEYFGTTIIGFFTDEPDIMGRGPLKGLKPWTGNFLEYFIQQGNDELDLPYLWFDAGEISEVKRKKYQEAVNKRMEEAYYKPIYEWCGNHKIALTGHPQKSDDIGYLKYFHMPAQDVVWRWVAPEGGLALTGEHSTMAKCTADSARHRGKRRNGNECFACCGKDNTQWSFSADDMKWYMDWLFVRGVNLLFPHAFFYSIDGPRRSGERPPDVGPNNIWWPYYKQVSDYIKRMSYFMTDSVNLAQVAILCEAHHLPWQIVKPLYENQIEFNYLENELFLSDELRVEESRLVIKNQVYKVLIIEDKSLIDIKNALKIQLFVNNGGRVIILNPDNKELKILNAIVITSFSDVVEKIDNLINRDITVEETCKDLRVTHIKKSGDEFYILVNEGEKEIDTKVRLHSFGSVERWDAWKGTRKEVTVFEGTETETMALNLRLNRRESVILAVNTGEVPKVDNYQKVRTVLKRINLDKDWYMGTEPDSLNKISGLTLWNDLKGMEYFSGTIIYQTEFLYYSNQDNKVSGDSVDKKVELDLGEVYEIAKVSLNGEEVGVQLWSPYIFDVTESLKEGENILVIEVTNTLANKMDGLSLQSGLAGPVNLKIIQE